MHVRALLLLFATVLPSVSGAQYYQSDFPPEEFRARWEKLFDSIGDDAVALVQGGPSARGFEYPRQSNNFYYLSGIETPHSYLWFDGRTREVALYLPPRNERLEQSEGRTLSADDEELVRKLTGVDEVRSTDEMAGGWLARMLGEEMPALYTPFRPAEYRAQSRYEIDVANANIVNDFWDGRAPREVTLINLLMSRSPKPYNNELLDVRNLSPILDEMRTVKSEREVAMIRRASEIAGLGMMEAIRSTVPGAYEFQLDAAARYVFLANGARLEAYRSITASGTENIANWHYYRNTRKLESGDLVLMDYAPDYGYYVSDIGRVWPVSGRFTPVQRELLEIIRLYRDELIKRIRPGVTTDHILEEAETAMASHFRKHRFSKDIYEAAAREMVENGRGAFSHLVGMAVHDVGQYRTRPLRPGLVFSVDPTLRVPQENLYLRYEDTVVVTEDGVENFTDFLPSSLDDIEALMREEGVLQKVPVVGAEP
jgi:Xaa-Pro aminopeptidase